LEWITTRAENVMDHFKSVGQPTANSLLNARTGSTSAPPVERDRRGVAISVVVDTLRPIITPLPISLTSICAYVGCYDPAFTFIRHHALDVMAGPWPRKA